MSQIKPELALAGKPGQVPAKSDPVLQDGIGRADVTGDLFGPKPGDPGQSGWRQGTLGFVVAPSSVALIVPPGLVFRDGVIHDILGAPGRLLEHGPSLVRRFL